MAITAGEDILAADFINSSEKDGTPANDNGRAVKLENDGTDDARIKQDFLPEAVINQNKKILVEDTDVSVNTTTTETTIFSKSIGAGVLGTNNAIRIKLIITNLDIEESLAPESALTIRLKYGATTLSSIVVTSETVQFNAGKGMIEAYLIAAGATAAQDSAIVGMLSDGVTNFDGSPRNIITVGNGTGAEDSTGALNLIMTAQWNQSDANNKVTFGMHIIELISA